MAEPNLGEALSLGYKMPSSDFAVQQIDLRRREDENAIKAARQAKNKALSDIDKYKDNFNKFIVDKSMGILPNYYDDIKAKTASLVDTFNQGRKKYQENYNPQSDSSFQEQFTNLRQTIDKHQQSTKKALAYQEEYAKDPENVEFNPLYEKAFNSGKYEDLIAANKETHGDLGDNDIITTGVITPKTKIDPNEFIDKIASQIAKGTTENTIEKGAITTTSRKVSERAVIDGMQLAKSSPEYSKVLSQLAASGITDDASKEKFLEQQIRNRLPSLYKQTEDEAKAASQTVLTEKDVIKNVPVNITVAQQGKEGKPTEDVAEYGFTLPSNVVLNIPVTKNVISTSTGRKIEEMVDDKQVPITGQMQIQGGKVLTSKFKEAGTGKIIRKPMLYTTATMQIMQDGESKTVRKDVQIPLDEIEGQKEIQKHSKAVNEIKRLTDELNNPKKESNKLQTINTQSEYDALPKGAKYVDSKGNKAIKK